MIHQQMQIMRIERMTYFSGDADCVFRMSIVSPSGSPAALAGESQQLAPGVPVATNVETAPGSTSAAATTEGRFQQQLVTPLSAQLEPARSTQPSQHPQQQEAGIEQSSGELTDQQNQHTEAKQ